MDGHEKEKGVCAKTWKGWADGKAVPRLAQAPSPTPLAPPHPVHTCGHSLQKCVKLREPGAMVGKKKGGQGGLESPGGEEAARRGRPAARQGERAPGVQGPPVPHR